MSSCRITFCIGVSFAPNFDLWLLAAGLSGSALTRTSRDKARRLHSLLHQTNLRTDAEGAVEPTLVPAPSGLRDFRRRCGGWRWCCVHGWRCGCAGGRPRSLRARGAAGERQQRDIAGALDGFAEPTLVTRADTGHAPRENLAALLHELRKDVGAFVVDEVHLLDAELADFLFPEVLALAAARAAWAAAGTSRAAFATRTAVTSAGAAVSAAGTVSATAWTARSG